MEKISYADWIPFGKGGYGTTYRHVSDDSLILKMGRHTTPDVAQREMEMSVLFSEMGINTPKVYKVVTDGKHYGNIGQIVNGKVSISRIIADNPSKTDEMAVLFAEKCMEFHSVECDTAKIKNRQQIFAQRVGAIRFLKDETKQDILDKIWSIRPCTTCIHGDMNPGNLIVANGKYYWIDLGDASYGNPVMDLGGFEFINELPDLLIRHLFHMPKRQLQRFYEKYLEETLNNVQDKDTFLKELEIVKLGVRAGILKSAASAVIFLPLLQKFRGDKPMSRLSIVWNILRGRKQLY